jgi:hypothetical protein
MPGRMSEACTRERTLMVRSDLDRLSTRVPLEKREILDMSLSSNQEGSLRQAIGRGSKCNDGEQEAGSVYHPDRARILEVRE